MVRAMRVGDAAAVAAVEVAAGAAFAAIGMPEIAADAPFRADELEPYIAAGRALVAERDGAVVAYVLWHPLDDAVHVEQVSVAPAAAGRGLGAALIDAAGGPPTTLTTFRDVPWNAPYYARLGFAVLAPERWGPQLRALVAREGATIPGDHPRVVMRRERARAAG